MTNEHKTITPPNAQYPNKQYRGDLPNDTCVEVGIPPERLLNMHPQIAQFMERNRHAYQDLTGHIEQLKEAQKQKLAGQSDDIQKGA